MKKLIKLQILNSFLALNLIENLEFIYKDKVLNSFDRNYLANYFKLNLKIEFNIQNIEKMSSIDELTIKNWDTFLSTADAAGMNEVKFYYHYFLVYLKPSLSSISFWALKDAE